MPTQTFSGGQFTVAVTAPGAPPGVPTLTLVSQLGTDFTVSAESPGFAGSSVDYLEWQMLDAAGAPLAAATSLLEASALTIAGDPDGADGAWQQGGGEVTASVPAGATFGIRCREAYGSGTAATVGAWSAVLPLVSPVLQPDVVLVSVALEIVASGDVNQGWALPEAVVTATWDNQGLGDGQTPLWSWVLVTEGFIWATGLAPGGVALPAGQTVDAQDSAVFGQGYYPPSQSGVYYPPLGTYTVYAAAGGEYAGLTLVTPWGPNMVAAGTASASASTPAGVQ